MSNQNSCVSFFERRGTDAKNKRSDNDNLRAVKYSICVLEQYKQILTLQDKCGAGPVKYYPKQIDFLQKAYTTIKNAEVKTEEENEEGGVVVKKPTPVRYHWSNGRDAMTNEVTLEDQTLVSKSL